MRTNRSVLLMLAPIALTVTLTGCGAGKVTNGNGNTAPAANTNTAKPAANTNTAAVPAATNAAPAGDQLSNLAITNKSKWAIHHLYLAPSSTEEWGPDQLGTNTIEPNGTFTIKNIPCDTYDIKVVDEGGDECMIKGEKFCGHEATWNLTTDALLKCEGYGDE